MELRYVFLATLLTAAVVYVTAVPVAEGRAGSAQLRHGQTLWGNYLGSLRDTRSISDDVDHRFGPRLARYDSQRQRRDSASELYDNYAKDDTLTPQEKILILTDYLNYLHSLRKAGNEKNYERYDMDVEKRQPPVGFHAVRGKRSAAVMLRQ